MAFSGLLPAPGGRTEELGGTDARRRTTEDRRDPRREARVFCCTEVARNQAWTAIGSGRRAMTMTKGGPAKPPSPDARRTHVPGDGTAGAAAVEKARKSMLDDSRP